MAIAAAHRTCRLLAPHTGVLVTAAKDAKTGGPRCGYAVDLGTLVQLDGHRAPLWVNGNAPDATLTGRPYLQGGKGTPGLCY